MPIEIVTGRIERLVTQVAGISGNGCDVMLIDEALFDACGVGQFLSCQMCTGPQGIDLPQQTRQASSEPKAAIHRVALR